MKVHSHLAKASSRHNPLTVSVHWLIALIVLIQALIGVGILHFWPNTAVKIAPLTLHILLGIPLFVLLVVQLVARFTTKRPAPATTGSRFLDFLAKATHALLYVFALLMGASGVLLAVQSHVLRLAVGGHVALPMYFNLFLHAAIFVLFGLLVGFHVLGALFHQFVLKDNLFARMGYARRRKQLEQPPIIGRPINNL